MRLLFRFRQLAARAGVGLALAVVPLKGGTVFVDATASAPEDGSPDHPFHTIQQAVDRAGPGDTVRVRHGVYREQIRLSRGGEDGRPLVIEADRIGSVTVDGADPVTGFKEDPNHHATDESRVWVYRAYHSPYQPMSNDPSLRANWLHEGAAGVQQVELVFRNDMVWLDGHFLAEVDSPAELRCGTFWVNRQAGGLYLALAAADEPGHHLIESAQRGPLFASNDGCSYVHLQGFHFTRSAAGFEHAVLELGSASSRGWMAEDNVADWGSYAGIKIDGSENRILRNVASDNGDEGFSGTIQDTLLEGNASLRNNWKGIRDTFEAGGGKFTQSNHVTVRHHLAAYNRGPGLWFDVNNKAITVEQSKFHDNNYAGLFFEISVGPSMIRGNTSWSNQGAGISIGESRHINIENNILADNVCGIELRNIQGRTDPAFGSWQTSDITIRNNVFLRNLRAGIANTSCYLDPGAARITSDDNIFWDNPSLWWHIPDPKGPFAGVPRPAQAFAILEGGWMIRTSNSKHEFGGLEEHSTHRDPGFPKNEMDNTPAKIPSNLHFQ